MPSRKPEKKKSVPAKTGRTRTSKPKEADGNGAHRKSAGTSAQRPPKKEMDRRRADLVKLRDRVTGQISFLSDDAVHTDNIPPEDRTDEFDREFAFNLVSTEQDALYEIDEALRRIDQGNYGRCESCDGKIESNRLRALPFARHCLGCQAELEQHTTRGGHARQAGEAASDPHRYGIIESPDAD